jgi:hypothetical protein
MTADQYLADAVLAYAARGFRVLPLHHPVQIRSRSQPGGVGCSCGDPDCGPVGKHPRPRNGLHDATSDPARLARWSQRWPNVNIGLVTGELADVLDVDGPAGRAALRRWATQHDVHLDGPLVGTGSGWHHYLAPAGSGNRAGLLEQVDWRGRGGYVIAPPSLHANGTRYRWLRPLASELPDVPWPLRNLLIPARQQQPEPPPRFREEPAGHPYGRVALQRELAAVAQAPKGRRNHTLYQAGIRLYSLVAGGVLDHTEVRAGLLGAADVARLLTEEPLQTHRTLASAERTGLAHPRGIPASDRAPRHLRSFPRGRNQPDAVTNASAMPELPPAPFASHRRPSLPPRSPANHGADNHRLAAAARHPAARPATPPVTAEAARPGAIRRLRQRPHQRHHRPGHPGAVLRRGPWLAPPHALRRGLRPSHPPAAIDSIPASRRPESML